MAPLTLALLTLALYLAWLYLPWGRCPAEDELLGLGLERCGPSLTPTLTPPPTLTLAPTLTPTRSLFIGVITTSMESAAEMQRTPSNPSPKKEYAAEP